MAEILIVIGIIGVIAALTIPTLINNYQKTQYATAAKKFYTTFNQALQQMAVKNGTPDSIADYFTTSTDSAGSAVAEFFKVVKTCDSTVQDDTCFAAFDNNYDGSAHSTSNWTSSVMPVYKFITADGMSIAVNSYNDSCGTNKGLIAAPDAPITSHSCGVVFVDINGKKSPNYYGRDVFQFYITSNRSPILYPRGGFYNDSTGSAGNLTNGGNNWWNYGNNNFCGTNASKTGWYCTGRLVEKGWEMDY